MVLKPEIVEDFAFCEQSVWYDHVKSTNSVNAAVHHEVTVIDILLADISYNLLIVYQQVSHS